jgi:hypothetical protein
VLEGTYATEITMVEHDSLLERALQSPEPVSALRSLVLELAAKGYTKNQIHGVFSEFFAKLQQSEPFRETDAEAIADVLDALTGWCGAAAELLPGEGPVKPGRSRRQQ